MVQRRQLYMARLAVSIAAWLMLHESALAFSLMSLSSVRRNKASALKYSNDEKDKTSEEEDSEARRMEAVRSLQLAFYNETNQTTVAQTRLDKATGLLQNLPLWRAPWWEVPGRSNVLNVHDPIYTNMFENILRGPKPFCFGHLYLKGGSENLKADGLPTVESFSLSAKKLQKKSAVLGCLMHIQDYRRFSNGRLLLLVHVVERFVVTDIHQELPYSIVDAQIVPDTEELDPSLSVSSLIQFPESSLKQARGLAVQESVRFHDYEFDPTHNLSGVANKTYLEATDILWSAIAKVLPYCPYSKTLKPPTASEYNDMVIDYLASSSATASASAATENSEEDPSLEYQMFQKGIFQTPLFDPDFDARYKDLTTDELEYEVWLALGNFLRTTKTPVSPIILGLLPPEIEEWPSEFQNILQIVQDFEDYDSYSKNPQYTHDFVRVAPDYPKHRRQRRLSYSVLYLLEQNGELATELRQALLKTSSTKQRLRLVLEKFHIWQEQYWGEFQ